jgi:hypothetical protein
MDSPPSLPPKLTTAAQLLLNELFNGQAHGLSQPFTQWVASSKPFTAFAQSYLSKIRKKIRMGRDDEERYNLYCELRTAFLLLQESKLAVAYEPYGMDQGRSADFAVTFRSNTLFHVEVTRMRLSQPEQQLFHQESSEGESSRVEQVDFVRRLESRRLTDVVCEKLGQLSVDTPNILWVWSGSRALAEMEIDQVMVGLKRGVEQRDADLFARYGFGKPADFIRFYQRLSVILLQNPDTQAGSLSPILWRNKDAKHPLPTKITTLLRSLVTADHSLPFAPSPIDENGQQKDLPER